MVGGVVLIVVPPDYLGQGQEGYHQACQQQHAVGLCFREAKVIPNGMFEPG